MHEKMYVIFFDGKPYMRRNHGDGVYWSRASAERGLAYYRRACYWSRSSKWEVKAYALTEINEGA